jgi:hypothetical protein
MQERRKFNRWNAEGNKNVVVSCSGQKAEAKLMDVSASGMRITLPHSLEVGASVSGELRIIPGTSPFFVAGKVNRVQEIGGNWELAVFFDKVGTNQA